VLGAITAAIAQVFTPNFEIERRTGAASPYAGRNHRRGG
jgi:hypothetical protein